MITLEDILIKLGSAKPFKKDGSLSKSGEEALTKLNYVVLGLNDIGAIKEKLDEVERYCAEIISLGL